MISLVKNKVQIQNFKINYFELSVLLLSLLICFPITQGFILVFLFLFFVTYLKRYRKPQFNPLQLNITIISLLVFVVGELLSLFYTSNIAYGLTQVEKRIPFLMILVAVLFFSKHSLLNFHNLVRFYSIGVILLLLLSTFYILYGLLFGELRGELNIYGLGEFRGLKFLGHRTYMGMIILFSFPYWYQCILRSNTIKVKLIYCLLVAYSIFIIVISGARGVTISMLVLLSYFLFDLLRKSTHKYITGLAVIAFVAVSVLFLVKSPRVKLLLHKNQTVGILKNSESRFKTWYSAEKLLENKWILGEGIGDSKDKLITQYEINGFLFEKENKLNAHNQYLETWIGSGLLPTISLLAFLISLLFVKNEKQIWAISFTIILGVNMIFESLWVRNMGVYLTSFWLVTLLLSKSDNFTEIRLPKDNRLLFATIYLNSVLAILILFYACGKVELSKPKSFMTIPYKVTHDSLNNSLSQDIIEVSVGNLSYNSFRSQRLALLPLSREKITENSNVNGGLWLKVPENSKLSSVKIYLTDKLNKSEFLEYNLDNSRGWQQLYFTNISFMHDFEFGIRVEVDPSQFDLYQNELGVIYITSPEIIISNKINSYD